MFVMVERTREKTISPIEFMRAVSSDLHDNMIAIQSDDNGNVMTTRSDDLASSAISMTTFGEKARLLSGIPIIVASGMPSSSDLLEQENMQLRNENLELRSALRRIEERLAHIEASLPTEKVILLREVSKQEAEKEIRKLFAEGQILYYSDIAERLGLDLQLVVEICNELQRKGEIEVVDDTLRTR